jgi:arylamine N-acetyltransferase
MPAIGSRKVAILQKRSRATSIFLDLYQINPIRPDLKLLGDISVEFRSLPWENLTKFIKKQQISSQSQVETAQPSADERTLQPQAEPRDARLRLSEEVMSDHTQYGTGGTCFSLTNTLRRIVTDLGYQAYPVMADMRHGPNIHCGLLVELDGARFLLDPGYLVAEPVPLSLDRTVQVRLPGHRLQYSPLGDRDEFELHVVNDRGEKTFRYRLRPQQIDEADFARHWLNSFDASGMNSLHLNRITDEGRLSAHNHNLRVDSGRSKLNLKLRSGYIEKVSDRFGIDPELVRRAYDEWKRQRCRSE